MVAISKTHREKDLQTFLLDLHDLKNRLYDTADFNEQLRATILSFGSNTPDNIDAVERIKLGNKLEDFGLKLTYQNLHFREILIALMEDHSVYKATKFELPDLSRAEWNAILNYTKLFIEDIENSYGLAYRMKEVHDKGLDNTLDSSTLTKINRQTKLLVENYTSQSRKSPSTIFKYLHFDLTKDKEANTKRYGIRLKNYIYLSDFFSILEEIDKPNFIEGYLDWEGFNRILVLFFMAFEGNETLH